MEENLFSEIHLVVLTVRAGLQEIIAQEVVSKQ